MAHPAQQFVDEHAANVAPLLERLQTATWNLNVTGKEEYARERAELDAALTRIYADAAEFARLKAWRARRIGDQLLARQVNMLHRAYLGNQKDEDTIARMAKLEADVELAFNTHRGIFEGGPASDNDLRLVLAIETDPARRRAAWEASKQVGPVVAPRVLDLVRLRNRVAQKMGFNDHYRMSLVLQEIDDQRLSGLLDELERQTRDPFAAAKAKLDAYLADRFRIEVEDLRPWHYADFFFQDAPADARVDLGSFFADRDLVALAVRTYDGIGLDIRPVLARSDLFPREGKSQHAFCFSIDRDGDVRVLCSVQPDEHWMSTLLHEFGHAAYDRYLDPELPFLLREPAHTLLTEAVAMVMGRLTKDGHWLRSVAGIPEDKLGPILPHIVEHSRLAMLVFVRWCLVMTHFERDLYRDPEQDLATLWWDYVEEFQMLTRPEGRREPDWAAKIHLAVAPVYYHNYLVGEMVASQLHHSIVERVNPLGVVDSPAVGEFLRANLFALGARYPWEETIEWLTGERLNPRYFAQQFVHG